MSDAERRLVEDHLEFTGQTDIPNIAQTANLPESGIIFSADNAISYSTQNADARYADIFGGS